MPMFTTDDLNIHYEIHGTGTPLVLLHGLGSSILDWENQVGVLSNTFQVVAIDLRGHGRSGKPRGPYSVPLFAADTANLLRFLKLPPAHVVGLSMGGMVAFQLALDAAPLVKSLCIINSGPELVPRTFKERLAFFQREVIVRTLGMRYMAELLGKLLLPEAEQKALRETLIQRWAKNDKKAYLVSLRAIVGWSVADRISSIDCPTLILSADQDYTPISFKQAYMAKIPQAKLAIIHNSRHMSPIDQPDQLNTALLEFFAQL